jgi:carboxypeptidase C (cathepsin A)
MSERVSAITGLDRDLVAQLRGRVSVNAFLREFSRAKAKILAPHDASLEAYDPEPEKYHSHWLDPAIEGLLAPLTSAAVDVYERRLGWKTDLRYELINFDVNKAWNWSHALDKSNESGTALRRLLALDPNMRVLIAHGLTDLVTPYYAAKLLLDQTPDFGPPGRVRLAVYPGGHMHYSRDGSRKALRRDARELFEGR